jgi:sRNA-binding carbon storage regulator CsrA
MSFYLVNNEYDLDLAVDECVKLMAIKHARVKVGFNNMKMVKIFMSNLSQKVQDNDLDPSDMDFHVDVLVEEKVEEEDDE